jgi:PhnB protein
MPNDTSPRAVVPCLVVANGPAAIDFYQRAFGAELTHFMPTPDGRVLHAALRMGGGTIYVSDDFPEFCDGRSRTPQALGGTPVAIHLQVPDAETTFARAIEAGGVVTMPLADMFWGDRYGKLIDPFGHEWSVSSPRFAPTRSQMEAAVRRFFGVDD